jgi:Uma2 family endonuclease
MPLPRAAKQPATYQDLQQIPPQFVAEIVDGELYASPRPASRHARAASRLGAALDGPFDRGRGGPGGWILLDEPELHVVGQIMVPDLAGWRRDRMPALPDVSAFELAPDWVCEVLSPATEALDRSLKMPRHADAGVSWAWLVDPVARVLEIYCRGGGSFHLTSRLTGDAEVHAPPFEAVPLELGALWAL